jgi:uncharacterized membrane protein
VDGFELNAIRRAWRQCLATVSAERRELMALLRDMKGLVGFIRASMFENARYFEYFVRTAKANLLEFAPATAQKNITSKF